MKTVDPFANAKKRQKTNFTYAYDSGSIPCRIDHGCNFNKLKWDVPPDSIDSYDPILINCCEGLLETEHPFSFLAFEALRQLLDAEMASDKTIPLLPRLVIPIRASLCSRDPKIWLNAIATIR